MSMTDEVQRASGGKHTKSKKKKSFSEAFIPHKNDSRKEIISKIISLISLVVLIVCIVILGVYFYHQFEAKQNNTNIKVIYNKAQNNSLPTDDVIDTVPSDDTQEDKPKQPLVVSDAAQQMLDINKDYAAFVSIPDVVNEAVVQNADNEYYLKHNFYDQTRSCGTVFADYRCTVNDYEMSDNITLYGHNQRDGTMFGQLDYYTWDYKYWLKNPFIYFDTKYSTGTYVIVSSFITNVDPKDDNGNTLDYQNYIDFDENGQYTAENFIKEITVRSHFITGVDINENDKFLTLSTCSYEWEPSRHVIVARRLRDGETTDNIDTTNFTVNSNPKWPAIYYKYNGGSYKEN